MIVVVHPHQAAQPPVRSVQGMGGVLVDGFEPRGAQPVQ